MKKLLLVLLLLLPLHAAVRFVDNTHPGADDGNTGTESAPWKTIQHGADQAGPGDTVRVRAGTYAPFAVTSSGAPGRRIIFMADPDDRYDVIVNGSGIAVRGGIMCDGHSHIEIRGFHVKRCTTDGIYVQGSAEGDSDIVIAGNRIDTTGNAGIYAAGLVMGQTIGVDEYRLFDILIENNEVTRTNQPSGRNECISAGGGLDGFVIRNNWVHDSNQYGIDAKFGAINGKIYGNRIHGIEKHGIYLDCASRRIQNVSVYGNDIHGNHNGIVLAREVGRQPEMPNLHDVNIFNNLVYDNGQYGIMAYKYKDDYATGLFDNIRIINNTVYRNAQDGIRLTGITDWATRFTVANNIVYGNTPEINNQVNAVEAANLAGTDPLFVSADAPVDLHLQTASPAAGTADTAYLPASDFDGLPRATADRGAFAYAATGRLRQHSAAATSFRVRYGPDRIELVWPAGTVPGMIRVHDLSGHTVAEEAASGCRKQRFTWHTGGYPAGVYIIRTGADACTAVVTE